MPSDEHNTASDAPNVLSDDAQASRTESRVRVLLGLQQENLILSSSVPPVGFRYAQDRFISEPDSIDLSPVQRRSQDAPLEKSFSPPATEEKDAPDVSAEGPGKTGAEGAQRNEKRARQRASQPEPAARENPVDAPQQTRLAIPGVSDQPAALPAFSDETAPEKKVLDTSDTRAPASLPAPVTEPMAGTPENPVDAPKRTGFRDPGVSNRPTAILDKITAGQTKARAPSTTVAAESPEKVVVTTEPKCYATAPITPHVRTAAPSQAGVKANIEYLTVITSQKPPAPAATSEEQALSSAVNTPRNNEFSRDPFRSDDNPRGRASGIKTSDDSIEQLRQTVYELTSKLTCLQAQVNNQARQEQRHTESARPERSAGRSEPTPPPPPRPVVIIKRSAQQGKPTQAFWARRYLGRLRCRPLR